MRNGVVEEPVRKWAWRAMLEPSGFTRAAARMAPASSSAWQNVAKNQSKERKRLAKSRRTENHAARYPPPRMDQQLLFLINRTATASRAGRADGRDVQFRLLVAAVAGRRNHRSHLWRVPLSRISFGRWSFDQDHRRPRCRYDQGRGRQARPNEVLEGVRSLDLEHTSPRFLAIGKPLRESYFRGAHPAAARNSFPSGHASNNFALATVSGSFYRRGWLVYLPRRWWPTAACTVGSHWPSEDARLGAHRHWYRPAGTMRSANALANAEPRWVPRLHDRHPTCSRYEWQNLRSGSDRAHSVAGGVRFLRGYFAGRGLLRALRPSSSLRRISTVLPA